MDYLPTDDQGLVPSIDFRTIRNDLWIGLNTSCNAIPSEALSTQRLPSFRLTGPTGMLLEMEWALDADWYNPDAGWRPFLPKPTPESKEWFFQLDHSTPVDLSTIAESGECSILPTIALQMEGDIRRVEACVAAIAQLTTFPLQACRLGYYTYKLLHGTFDDTQALEDFGMNCKRQVLDYLAFINWWTSSVSYWDRDLPQVAIDAIIELNLPGYRRRGVLIDLQKDWRQISLPHLLKQRIPTFIKWSEELDKEDRFLSISPHILHAFEEKRKSAPGATILAAHMPELAADFELMKDYDELFQLRVFNRAVAPGIKFRDDWSYAVIDFQGWMYRPIPIHTAMEFVTRFGSHIIQYNDRTLVVFHRWEALHDEASISPPAGTPGEGSDGEIIRGYLEIREIHRSFYAPYDRQKFDLNGYPDYGTEAVSPRSQTDTSSRERPFSGRPPHTWIEAMHQATHSASRSSLSGGVDRGRMDSWNSKRLSPYPRPHSQSPSRRQTYQRRNGSPFTNEL